MSYPVYQASGIVPSGIFPAAAACIAVTLPVAGVYAWLIWHLPDVLNFFVACAFALFMANLVKRVCHACKVRSPRWIGRFGVLLGICGWYLQWSVWLVINKHADVNLNLIGLLANSFQLGAQPAEMLRQAINVGSSATGWDKYLVFASWLGESWMLLFFPYYMGKMRAEEPFDEVAGKWADYVLCPAKFKPVEQAGVHSLMISPSETLGDVLVIEPDKQSKLFSQLRIYPCQGGESLVSIVTVEINGKDGTQRVIESSPGNYLRVPTEELDILLAEASGSSGMEQSDQPELVNAIQRLQAGDYKAALDEALPFVLAEGKCLNCDANRLCAIASSELKQWKQAARYWQALFTKESTAHNALQVASSTVMAGEVQPGLAWAERARSLNSVSNELPDIVIITTLLTALTAADHTEVALPLLEELRDFYTQLRVTDPTFLFGHHMPLFHVFLEKSEAVVHKVLGKSASRDWYASMLPHLDERGKAELTAWLDGASAHA